MSLSKLIQALNIFVKYGDVEYPTHCNYDELLVMVDPILVSKDDISRLEELGFSVDYEDNHFRSYLYGSA